MADVKSVKQEGKKVVFATEKRYDSSHRFICRNYEFEVENAAPICTVCSKICGK